MRVVVLEDAAQDLEEGRHFYEEREAGVGEYFAESLLADLHSLVLYAGTHARHFGLFRMLAARFPYAIYYEVEGEVAYVYAVLDMRRDPLHIRDELQGRT